MSGYNSGFDTPGSGGGGGGALPQPLDVNSDVTFGSLEASGALKATSLNVTGTISGSNIDIPTTTATTGQITQNGGAVSLLHTFGTNNFFLNGSGNKTLTTADTNIGIGVSSLAGLTSSDDNIAIGENALNNLTSGQGGNIAIGYNAGARGSAITAQNCIFIGEEAGQGTSSATHNIAIGFRAMGLNIASPKSGNDNIAIGQSALERISSGLHNVAIGKRALADVTTAERNTSHGCLSLSLVTTNNDNTAIGYQSGGTCTGGENVFLGYKSGYRITTPTTATALGFESLGGGSAVSITGENNTVCGKGSLRVAQGACADNSAFGFNTGVLITTGTKHCLFGSGAGAALTTETANVMIGYQAGGTATVSNALYIANSNTTTPLIKGDFATGSLQLGSGSSNVYVSADNGPPVDEMLHSGSISFYIDDSGNNLNVRVRYADGTLKTGTVALV